MQSNEKQKISTSMRGVGSCKELTGNNMIMAVFVSSDYSKWRDDRQNMVINSIKSAIKTLYRKASKYGVSVSMQVETMSVSSPYDVSNKKMWMDYLLKTYFNGKTLTQASVEYAKKYGKKSCAFIFFFDTFYRPYAVPNSIQYTGAENSDYAVIAHTSVDPINSHSILHELLHIYGAIDLYYPEKLKTVARIVYPTSIMLSSAYKSIDSLTAYLIGWTAAPDYRAKMIIDLIEKIGPYDPPKTGVV